MTAIGTKYCASSGAALVIGASAGLGAALCDEIARRSEFAQLHGLSRNSLPAISLLSEASIAWAAAPIARRQASRCACSSTPPGS